MEDLRRRFRRYRVIHVICDNARFHTAPGVKLVRQYLAEHADGIRLHYLPLPQGRCSFGPRRDPSWDQDNSRVAYSPQDNPIERVWWHLHEQITRNHCCHDVEELVKLTMAWLDEHGAFKIEGSMYERLKRAVT